MRFETNVTDRKMLARKLAEFTGESIHYLGPPSFAYSVGGYLIARDGAVSTESEEGSEALRVFLDENNLLKPEVTELVIRLPLPDMDADALKRLVYMVRSKQYLLNKAIGAESIAVSEELVAALETTAILDYAAFLDVFSRYECRGLAFDMENVSMTFQASKAAEKNEAFAYLAAVMVRKAREAKRISSKVQEPENEKYYFRIWLVQLGMDGGDCKTHRQVLLSGLKGHSAFRTEADAAKFSANQKAKRNARKAEQGGCQDA